MISSNKLALTLVLAAVLAVGFSGIANADINNPKNVGPVIAKKNIIMKLPAGKDGKDGKDGANGANGHDGAPGPVGPQGPQGPPGVNGSQGEQGPAGPQGEQGPAGPAGMNGTQGEQGPAGPQGPPGVNGTNGVNGRDGTNGTNGRDGQDASATLFLNFTGGSVMCSVGPGSENVGCVQVNETNTGGAGDNGTVIITPPPVNGT